MSCLPTCWKCKCFKCAFPCFTQHTVSFSHTFQQIYSPLAWVCASRRTLSLWQSNHSGILSEVDIGSHVKFLGVFIISYIWIHWQIFVKIVIIRFHKSLFSGSHGVSCRQTERARFTV
jgi:hypothetical protein